jgi:hypothetical protein
VLHIGGVMVSVLHIGGVMVNGLRCGRLRVWNLLGLNIKGFRAKIG